MANQTHVVASGDTNAHPRLFDSVHGSTAVEDHPVLERHGGDLAASETEAASTWMTALYGVHRGDGIWVTECAWCRRIRTIAGDWQTVPAATRSAICAERTHGICADCADRYVGLAAEHVDA